MWVTNLRRVHDFHLKLLLTSAFSPVPRDDSDWTQHKCRSQNQQRTRTNWFQPEIWRSHRATFSPSLLHLFDSSLTLKKLTQQHKITWIVWRSSKWVKFCAALTDSLFSHRHPKANWVWMERKIELITAPRRPGRENAKQRKIKKFKLHTQKASSQLAIKFMMRYFYDLLR